MTTSRCIGPTVGPPPNKLDADLDEYDGIGEYTSDEDSLGESLIEDSDEGRVVDDEDDQASNDGTRNGTDGETAEEPQEISDSDTEADDEDTLIDSDHGQAGVADPREQDDTSSAGVGDQDVVGEAIDPSDTATDTAPRSVTTRSGRVVIPPKNYIVSSTNATTKEDEALDGVLMKAGHCSDLS